MSALTFKDPSAYTPGEIIISSENIDQRVQEIVHDIASKYTHKQLLVVGLLKGAAWISVDIFTKLFTQGVTDSALAFMKVKSYVEGTAAKEEPQVTEASDIDFKGRHILVVDDICDTGKSLQIVTESIKNHDAASIATLVLLDKPSRRKVDFIPDYVGFTIPNIWVQGRGMDTDEYGRGNPNIICGPWKE